MLFALDQATAPSARQWRNKGTSFYDTPTFQKPSPAPKHVVHQAPFCFCSTVMPLAHALKIRSLKILLLAYNVILHSLWNSNQVVNFLQEVVFAYITESDLKKLHEWIMLYTSNDVHFKITHKMKCIHLFPVAVTIFTTIKEHFSVSFSHFNENAYLFQPKNKTFQI